VRDLGEVTGVRVAEVDGGRWCQVRLRYCSYLDILPSVITRKQNWTLMGRRVL